MLFLLLCFSLPLAAQQVRDAKPAPAAPAAAGTGAIGGVVTGDDGSRPVRFAYVVLIGAGTGLVKVSSTDADGRFAFAGLPADRYTIGASKPPYLGTVAGARRPARPGTPIALADGQKIGNVAIRMPMGAAIAGVILDETGQPQPNVSVAIQQWRMQGGERTLAAAAANTVTDDRGAYRFHGLAPGEYVVGGLRLTAPPPGRALTVAEVEAALRAGTAPPVPAPATPARYAPVYFPGTTRPGEAVAIAVAAGEERQNVDFRLSLVQASRVEGTVVGADGQVVTLGSVSRTPIGVSLLRDVASVRIMPDGRFSFQNVMPGTYAVVSAGAGPNANQFAYTTVDVFGTDVLGVQLTMRPLLSFTGRLEFRGAAPPPALAGRRIPVRQLTGSVSGVPAPSVAPTVQAGTFVVTNVFPGSYLIGGPLPFGPTADSVTWALESVTVDGRDVTDLPIDITAETVPKDVVVTFSDRYQEVSGRLTGAGGVPAPEHTIVVFPEDKAYWLPGSRRIVTTRPGTDGRFTLSGSGPTTLPAGRYRLAAVTDIGRDEQFDPSFLAALVPASVPLTLQPGEKKVQDLAIR